MVRSPGGFLANCCLVSKSLRESFIVNKEGSADGRTSGNRVPREHSRAEIASDGVKEPFLYNPRSKAVEAGKVRKIKRVSLMTDGDCCNRADRYLCDIAESHGLRSGDCRLFTRVGYH